MDKAFPSRNGQGRGRKTVSRLHAMHYLYNLGRVDGGGCWRGRDKSRLYSVALVGGEAWFPPLLSPSHSRHACSERCFLWGFGGLGLWAYWVLGPLPLPDCY